ETILLGNVEAQISVFEHRLRLPSTQTARPLPKMALSAMQVETIPATSRNGQGAESVVVIPDSQPEQDASVEIIQLEPEQIQTKKRTLPVWMLMQNKVTILIGTLAAVFLLLTVGGAWYLRRARAAAAMTSPGVSAETGGGQAGVAPAQVIAAR